MFLMISGGHIGTPTWRLHRKLYKGAWNVSPNTSETVGHKDQRLGREIVYILVFYNISFSQTERSTRFVPFFEQKIQGFSRTPFSTKKSLESMSFLVLPQHEQLYREGLSLFAPLGTWESGLDKINTESQGLSGTDCNFHGPSRPLIFILKLKDFQGASEPRIQVRRWIVQIGLVFNGMINSILNRNIRIWSNGTQPYWLL